MYSPADSCVYYAESNVLKRFSVAPQSSFVEETLFEGASSGISEIWALEKTADGLFFRDENALFRWGDDGLKRYSFRGRVDAIGVIGGQMLVCVRGEGLMRYADKQFVPCCGTPPYSADEKVVRLLPYRDGCLLVTESDGLYYSDGEAIRRLETPFDDTWKRDNVICADACPGKLALGTVSSGVFVFGPAPEDFHHLDLGNGLQNNTVLSVLFDRGGDLWLGLDNGIDQVLLAAPEQALFHHSSIGAGYASALFLGDLYLGTNQGLFRMRAQGRAEPAGGVKGQVWDLSVIDGALYCSTDKGLYVLGPHGERQFIPLNGVWRVLDLQNHPGWLLGASYDRLFLLKKTDGPAVRFTGYLSGFEDSSKAFEEDADGSIWLSHWQKGLFRLELSPEGNYCPLAEQWGTAEGFPTEANNIPNRVGDQIVFTTEVGFYRLDAPRRRVVPDNGLNALFRRMPPALRVFDLPDSVRYFSSGTWQAIEYPAGGEVRVLDTLTLKYLCGKRKLGFDHIRSLSRDRILINTEDGFSVIRVDRLRERLGQTGPLPVIHSVHVTGPAGDSLVFVSEMPARPGKALTLDYRSNSLRFDFISPDFNGASGPYGYMLEKYDRGWSPYSPVRSKEYTRLPPGEYVFRVRTMAGESSLPVRIIPPWYRTGWAYALYALLVLAALFVLYMALERHSRRQAEQEAHRREEQLRKEQYRRNLADKAHDLTVSTSDVIRKNEILRKIYGSLDQLEPCLAPDSEGPKVLEHLRESIRENIGGDNAWQQFETNFDIVYQGFMKNLKERYPGLGKADRRMCAYLKMGLRTKEIASLMNMTPRSVEMTRHRIRRKMGLSRETNLSDFLDRME